MVHVEPLFTRSLAIARRIERVLSEATATVDAALYRLEEPALARALSEATQRGLQVRLVLDRGKLQQTPTAERLVREHRLPYRLSRGRDGKDSKMHHKFALIDGHTLFTGSYNWTPQSEEENYENMLIVREPSVAEAFRDEFETLWNGAKEPE
ncbi:MAG: phospholipase D-like domain-containing protein [Terriglobia bacterium]